MIYEQVNILEQLSNVSLFNEKEANRVWEQLFRTVNEHFLPNYDPKNIRRLFSSTNKFADCTAISK